MLILVILIAIAAVVLVALLLSQGTSRLGSARWRESRHVSDDGQHVVSEVEFD